MQLRSKLPHCSRRAILALALTAFAHTAFAASLIGSDSAGNRLVYMKTPGTSKTMTSVGSTPVAVVVGPTQQMIYALSGKGEVHVYNPYTDTDTILAKGLSNPTDITLEPGCASILVSDVGVNKIYRINFAPLSVSVFYDGPDTIRGLIYDVNTNLFANDVSQNAVVQFSVSGLIIGQTPAANPLIEPEGLTYDKKTNQLFATSNTGQVIYAISDDLFTVNNIAFTGGSTLEGIVSNGSGTLYFVGGDGTNNNLYQYSTKSGTTTKQNAVTGLNRVSISPTGPCIQPLGTDSTACEE